MVQKSLFGHLDEKEILLFQLRNKNGMTVEVMNYGATITSIKIPARNGLKEIVCGFDTLEKYLSPAYAEQNPYFGATVGRYGNRIKNGQFSIEGKMHQLTTNEGANHLHGGAVGFDKCVWNVESSKDHQLTFSLLSKDMNEGYPGELAMEVSFDLNDSNELIISFDGTCSKSCPISLTNHSYFNLSGFEESISNHTVMIDSDFILEKDQEGCPNGVRDEVEGATDFRKPKKLNDAFEKRPDGFDDYYLFRNQQLFEVTPVATLYSEKNEIKLEVKTSEPGMQFYTANFLNGTLSRKRDLQPYCKLDAFCCEPQRYPNGPNIEASPGSITEMNTPFKSQTIYKLDW